MNIKSIDFIEKKMRIIELFLGEKMACIPLREIPRRCENIITTQKEIWRINGIDVLEASVVITEEGNPAFKFANLNYNNFDYNMLQDIIQEVFFPEEKIKLTTAIN